MSYLRVNIARWTVSLNSPEGQAILQQIQDKGLAVMGQQPGFLSYRLMRLDSHSTIAVAEWESQELGIAGFEQYRQWLISSHILDSVTLETYAGEVIISS
jgi:hypothetical protein